MNAPSSHARPEASGHKGAVSAAHPLAVSAGLTMLSQGGNAVDAVIAAQAVLCVVLPSACGLGGDALVLLREPDGTVTAVNGTGAAPAHPQFMQVRSDGTSVTVPGLVHAWQEMSARWGRLSLGACLAPAIALAEEGSVLGRFIAGKVAEHHARLCKGQALGWSVVQGKFGERVRQRELAALLTAVAEDGAAAFYSGPVAAAMAEAAGRSGGLLDTSDLAAHESVIRPPVSIDWMGARVHVQPPMTQGILLPMCLQALEALATVPPEKLSHACIELTKACFEHRDRIVEEAALLDIALDIDLDRAVTRSGPRAYLHTAGAATADRDGFVASSLVSIFDDFGSGIFVPEGGFVLNNRAEGFTSAPNDAGPGKRPVHTLAPALLERDGRAQALATPGADGQIQTLLQVLTRLQIGGMTLAEAIHAPRWRSEDGKLLIPAQHPDRAHLEHARHILEERADDDGCFGGFVSAGVADGVPLAASDWRREVWHGVV